jgi:Domain of unknown function (DUF4178)
MSEPTSAMPPPMPKSGKPKTFSCPNCGGTVKVIAAGHSVDAVCYFCSSVIDVANENLRLIKTANERSRQTLIPIGRRGALAGIQWEAIGYLQKVDGSGLYFWDEYLLYNPYHGFRFLVQNRGHWTLFKVLKRALNAPDLDGEVRLDGKKYKRFLRGLAKVVYVKGEFYWRVKQGELERVADFIAPPSMLSSAGTDEELTISVGDYVSAQTVAKAFGISENMPLLSGVAPNQPAKYSEGYVGTVWWCAFAAIALATVLQVGGSTLGDSNKYLYSNSWDIDPHDKDKTLVSNPIQLPKSANWLVTTTAPLNNDWLELDVAIVNAQDETVSEFKQAIEFYSGSDYDGYWSEGNLSSETLVPTLPKGEYKLLLDADAGAFQAGRPLHFSLEIRRNIPVKSNYWLTVVMLLLYPAYIAFRQKSFENARWSESDIAPPSPSWKEDT